MAANSIFLLLMLSIFCPCSTRDVYIQPSEGAERCPGTCYNINTFGKMAHNNFSNSTDLIVHFLEGTHLFDLQGLVVFRNLTNAVFEGDGRMEQGFHETVWQSTVVIKCTEHSSTGIAFVNSFNITFRYITITNCGADMANFCRITCRGSLGYFKTDYNIALDHVSIQNGTGNGLLIENDGVDLIITHSSFAQNYVSGHANGGNIAIMYAEPFICDLHVYKYSMSILNTNVSFGVSEQNNAEGIVMHLSQKAYSVAILLDSVIAYSNKGLDISAIQHDVPTYSLIINNSLSFGANGSAFSIFSTQAQYDHFPCTLVPLLNFSIIIVNSKFVGNNNKNSDAIVSIFLSGVKFTSRILIKACEISHNIGLSGLELKFYSYHYQSQYFVTLENFIARNNSWLHHVNMPSAVYASFVTILVLKNVSISNNDMTGLNAYHTNVVVNGTSVFHNNTGIDGGGLAMYRSSYLIFHDDSFLNFTNNNARHRGGAIFADMQVKSSPCFFQYSDNTRPDSVKVKMTGNNANKAGTALFGGNINGCLLFFQNLTYGRECFNKTFEYSTQTGPSVISSQPTDVCFCDDSNTINCSQTQLTMTAYHGEEFNISVVTVGQENGVAPGILHIRPLNSEAKKDDVQLHNTNAMNCTTITITPIDTTYLLLVEYAFEIESPYKSLNISFLECPFGFQITNKTRTCDCEELRHISTTIKCDAVTNMITRQGDIWIGNISDCATVQTPCPFDYCNTALVNFSFTDPDPQCAFNRTGILCGGCKQNFSLALGSNNCIECPQFSYIALIIPFAAAGFVLIALLMVLNLTVSIGTINGLIFYASIVKTSESTGIFLPNGPILVLSQFIAWLNLDLGIETCFYHGMTAYAKMWLQFVFPLYIWFIIATIIVLCHYSTWLSNKIGGNVVQVLATLILLSFSKIFRTAVLAIKFTTLSCANSGKIISKFVWSMDGNVTYLSPKHCILMAAAVLFLLFAVPYTLALLFDPVIEKYLTRMTFFRKQWIKFKPFVDAYHGPYKDNCRFWTGLLLLVRMSFTLVSLHLSTYVGLIFITTSTSVLLSLMIFYGGVYQKNYLNILEWSSLINLSLLSAIYSVLCDKLSAQHVVTIISVSVAVVTFVGVIVFHAFSWLKSFLKLLRNYFYNVEESEKLLKDKENPTCQQLVPPTSSDVWMRRESLIY